MLRADELFNDVTQESSGKTASQGMFVGCSVDTSTGFVTFACEGKQTKFVYKVIDILFLKWSKRIGNVIIMKIKLVCRWNLVRNCTLQYLLKLLAKICFNLS